MRPAGGRVWERQTAACQKRRRGENAWLPFAGARQLLDSPDDEIALDAAEAIDEERAVEMVHFVLKRTGQKTRPFALMLDTFPIEAFYDRAFGPDDGRVEARNAEAALLLELHALASDELRIDHHNQAIRIAAEGDVDNKDSQCDPDLRRRQTDPRRGVHRLDHVCDNGGDIGRNRVDRPGRLVQELVAI